jgi:hypothetical protein
MNWPTLAKKSKLGWPKKHWHAKIIANHPKKDQNFGHNQNIGRVILVTIQTCP